MRDSNEKELAKRAKMRQSLHAKMVKIASKPPRSVIANAKSYSTGLDAVYARGTRIYATDSFAMVRADLFGDDNKIAYNEWATNQVFQIIDVLEGRFTAIEAPYDVRLPRNEDFFDRFLDVKSYVKIPDDTRIELAFDASEQKRVLDCFIAAGIAQAQIMVQDKYLRFHGVSPDFCIIDACIACAILNPSK